MACGTPVVALNRGSVPEVVHHGVTGFVVNTLEEMGEAIERVDQINPWHCRQHVEFHFDVPRMADDYLAVYQRILEAGGRWFTGEVASAPPLEETVPYAGPEAMPRETATPSYDILDKKPPEDHTMIQR